MNRRKLALQGKYKVKSNQKTELRVNVVISYTRTDFCKCDAVVHVVRCFEDPDVIHVDGNVDPIRDAELINLELALTDLSQVEKRLERVSKDRKADPIEKSALEKVAQVLLNDEPARHAVLEEDEEKAIKSPGLFTR